MRANYRILYVLLFSQVMFCKRYPDSLFRRPERPLPYEQVLVEMLHKAQTVSVEEYALQIQPTKVTKMELREPEVVAEPAGAGAEEGENTNHAASEASDGLGRDQAETAASLSGTTNEKAEAEERARLEKIQVRWLLVSGLLWAYVFWGRRGRAMEEGLG